MALPQLNGVIQQLRATVAGDHGCGDGQLLERYLTWREEAAFEALVRRHGPMVLGVCHRVLRNAHDTEDAFQATFLVLVRKAESIRPRDQVGNWLYGVAYRTALKAKAMAAKQAARERTRPRPELLLDEPVPDWIPLLDRELSKLPDKYRAPVVLCDLEGKTRKDAACALGWPEGTLSTRLTRARALLGERLARRGVTLAGGVALALAGSAAPANVLPALAPSAKVVALTEGVLKTMLLTKLKTALVVALALLIVGLGVGAGAYHSSRVSANQGGDEPREEKSRLKVIGIPQSKTAYGRTVPGEGWRPYGTTEEQAAMGIYIDVDTSEAKFKSVPIYLTSLGGDTCHWELTGVSAIYPRLDKDDKPLPLESGFRVYLRYPPVDADKLAAFQDAQKKWYLNWVAYGE
jgi:RNA polymerase sigma factor (sigma-70 family)